MSRKLFQDLEFSRYKLFINEAVRIRILLAKRSDKEEIASLQVTSLALILLPPSIVTRKILGPL